MCVCKNKIAVITGEHEYAKYNYWDQTDYEQLRWDLLFHDNLVQQLLEPFTAYAVSLFPILSFFHVQMKRCKIFTS